MENNLNNLSDSDLTWCRYIVDDTHKESVYGPKFVRWIHTSKEKANWIAQECSKFATVTLGAKSEMEYKLTVVFK